VEPAAIPPAGRSCARPGQARPIELSEPDVITALLDIGRRARIILDDAALPHSAKTPPEDQFRGPEMP
jgi:hypothetical protein